MQSLYCGKFDAWTQAEDIYGNETTLCRICWNWAPVTTQCVGCDTLFSVVEEVDGYHSLECKQLSEGSAWADMMEG